MATKNALIVAHQRSGGTLLCHFLSNHPQIFCPRDEPLNERSLYKTTFKAPGTKIAEAIWKTPGYPLTMFKVTYQQFVRDLLSSKVRVIHLYRQNVLRTIVSRLITREYRAGTFPNHRSHTVGLMEPVKLKVDVGYVIDACNKLQVSQERMKEALKDVQFFELTYEGMTGYHVEVNRLSPALTCRLCEFLRVKRAPLACELRRVNRYPLSQVIDNWEKLKGRMAGTVFVQYLEGE